MTPLTITIIYAAIAVAVFAFLVATKDKNSKADAFECAIFALFWPWCILIVVFAKAMTSR
jgi:hypothetical protein